MLPRWRRLLSWILALWLPLHGGVALALGHCASMQLQQAAVAAMPTESATPCHGHDPATTVPAEADRGDAMLQDGGACAHCAACQVQAAAAPQAPALGPSAPPRGWSAAGHVAPPERAPDSLERPPRPTHA